MRKVKLPKMLFGSFPKSTKKNILKVLAACHASRLQMLLSLILLTVMAIAALVYVRTTHNVFADIT